MSSNIDRYKSDYKKLLRRGELLREALGRKAHGQAYDDALLEALGGNEEKLEAYKSKLPNFLSDYQSWYSESMILIKQLLPDRLADFVRLYEKPKNRKEITYGNYVMEDALQNLQIKSYGSGIIADIKASIPQMDQQIAILKSLDNRFESSLYDIRQLVQADLLDSELESAKTLLRHRFVRAAGAVAGVVFEKHLAVVCVNHKVMPTKKNPTINDFNEALKGADIIDIPQWRFNQHLGDIRNLCDHGKDKDPTAEQVDDLITGVTKVTKTLF